MSIIVSILNVGKTSTNFTWIGNDTNVTLELECCKSFACLICLLVEFVWFARFARFACLMPVFTFASVHSHSWFRHALTSRPPFLLLTEKHAAVMILRITTHHPTIPDGFLKVFPSLSSRAASTTNMQKASVNMIHVRPQFMFMGILYLCEHIAHLTCSTYM